MLQGTTSPYKEHSKCLVASQPCQIYGCSLCSCIFLGAEENIHVFQITVQTNSLFVVLNKVQIYSIQSMAELESATKEEEIYYG